MKLKCLGCFVEIPFGKRCDYCAEGRAKEWNRENGYREDGTINHARAIFTDENGNPTNAWFQACDELDIESVPFWLVEAEGVK